MSQIDEVRSKIDIIELINEYVPLKKAGRNWRALCPFHSEKTPSFMVSPELGIYKCFGCGRGGNVFTFLMEYEKMTFGEALRFLTKRAGVKLVSYRPSSDEAEKEKLYQINHLAGEFYHYLLLNHRVGKTALNYILGRGITKKSLTLFRLGYAPAMWDGAQRFLVDKKGYQPQDLEKAGLVIPSQKWEVGRASPKAMPAAQSKKWEEKKEKTKVFYDRFRNRLIFPLTDHRGNVCGFAGRTIPPESKEAPKYINTPETLIYHKSELLYGLSVTKEEIKKIDSVVIVEGELDAISSYQVGVENVVAIKGSALTEQQARLLKRYTENITLALDTDIAGDAAARRGIEIADGLGFNIRIATFGKYKDPDEAAQKEPEFYKKKIREAVGIYDFLIDSAFQRFKGETPEEKKKIGQELTPALAKISDEIVKAHYVKLLAKRLGVEEEAIWSQTARQRDNETARQRDNDKISNIKYQVSNVARSRRDLLEEYLLAILFQSGGKTLMEGIKKAEDWIKEPANKRILVLLENYLEKKKTKFELKKFGKSLPEELSETFSRLCLLDLEKLLEDTSRKDREVEKAIVELEKLTLRERFKEISEEIGKLEKEGKEEEIGKLEKELKELSERLK